MGGGGLEEGSRQLRLLFLEEGAALPSSVGADTPSPPGEFRADGVGLRSAKQSVTTAVN